MTLGLSRDARKIGSPHDAGVVTQLREQQARHRSIGSPEHLLGEGSLRTCQEQVSCVGHSPADHERIGIDYRGEIRQTAAKPRSHDGEGLDRDRIS